MLPSFIREKDHREEPQLIMIASDGELYGHHQPFRDRFLAHLVDGASSSVGFRKNLSSSMAPKAPGKKMDKYSRGYLLVLLTWGRTVEG